MATRERMILDALFNALVDEQIENVADRVYEERGFSIPAAQLPAVDVMPVDGTPIVRDLGDEQLLHALRVEVAVMVVEGNADAPSRVADPIVAAVHHVVMTDPYLATLVEAITPGPYQWRRQETGDGVVLRRSAIFTLEHTTTVQDLELAP